MMVPITIKTVAVAGASGNIGAPLVEALHAANMTITALTRKGSKASFPAYVQVRAVDYSDIPDLTDALRGHDAVVSCVGSLALDIEPALVEAAAAAGVKRFLPAEYGADTLNARTRAFPVLAQKIGVQELLKRKAEETGGMTFSLLFTGLFLDWGMEVGLIIDVRGRKGTLYDGGDRVVSMTTIGTIAKGIVGCLLHPAETENRGVYIQDVAVSQNKIVDMARRADPGKEWLLKEASTVELEKQAEEAAKRKNPDLMSMAGSVFRMYFGGQEYGQPFAKLDNELLGIKGMDDAELEELVRKIMGAKS